MGGGDTSAAAAKEDNENNATGDQKVIINVRCSNGSKFTVQVALDSSVGSFKSTLAQHSDIPAEQQRLIYKGRILKDEQTLTSYGNINYPNLYFDFDTRRTCYPKKKENNAEDLIVSA